MVNERFWRGRKVFVTGHTGFKGSWLILWLKAMGAEVTGYALAPSISPNMYELCGIGELVNSVIGDVRNASALARAMKETKPDVVFHMAAQPLVLESYRMPADTYAVNVMGTVHLLEAVRDCGSVQCVVNVTTDKCYDNREWAWGYRENEPLGGYDPYSSSKACSELVTSSYRSSFFHPRDYDTHGIAVATARAGNVIGGGDWSVDRLIPDSVRSLLAGEMIRIRRPHAIRPWQHVLEPLSGYLLLAEKLVEKGPIYAEAWNFGPGEADAKPVEQIVQSLCRKWGGLAGYEIDDDQHPHEAHYLKLDCSKARQQLGWSSRWSLETALDKVVEWVRAYEGGLDMARFTQQQIRDYLQSQSDSL